MTHHWLIWTFSPGGSGWHYFATLDLTELFAWGTFSIVLTTFFILMGEERHSTANEKMEAERIASVIEKKVRSTLTLNSPQLRDETRLIITSKRVSLKWGLYSLSQIQVALTTRNQSGMEKLRMVMEGVLKNLLNDLNKKQIKVSVILTTTEERDR